jgi:hypothetical protein
MKHTSWKAVALATLCSLTPAIALLPPRNDGDTVNKLLYFSNKKTPEPPRKLPPAKLAATSQPVVQPLTQRVPAPQPAAQPPSVAPAIFQKPPAQVGQTRKPDPTEPALGPKPPKSGPVTPDLAHRVRREGGEYDDATLTFTLGWNDRNDLDLHVTSPDGGEIWFHNKRVDGGVLDVDMNIIGDSVEPVENVSWSKAFPRGKYKVRVVYYEKYGPDTTDFTLQVRYGKTTETVSGTVRQVKDQGEYEFDIP